MTKMGRPSYDPLKHPKKAYELSLLGLTNPRISQLLDISRETLNKWMNAHPDLADAIKKGRDHADSKVAKSLYQRAMGYSHPEDKIFLHRGQPVIVNTVKHYPPDTASAIFWLKNRQKELWRDKIEYEAGISGSLERVLECLPEGLKLAILAKVGGNDDNVAQNQPES